MKRKPALIPEWKSAWRFVSIKIAAVGTAFAGAWLLVPQAQQSKILSLIGQDTPGIASLLTFVAIAIGRVMRLKDPDPPPSDQMSTTTVVPLDDAPEAPPPPKIAPLSEP